MNKNELILKLFDALEDHHLPLQHIKQAERLAEALDDGLRCFMLQAGLRPAMWGDEWERARAAFLQSLTGPTTRGKERP